MNRLTILLFLLILSVSVVMAQSVFRIDSLPKQGVMLDKVGPPSGWKFQLGDDPAYAQPDFDDSRWDTLNPTNDIFELPQLPKTGAVFWMRFRLYIDSALNQPLALLIEQSGASEIYLNGKLIHRLGVVSATPSQIKAFNPQNRPILFPVRSTTMQTLAVRYTLQPNIRYATPFGWTNPLFISSVQPMDSAITQYITDYSSNQKRGTAKVAVYAILSLLFFALFVFFPTRKAHLHFAVYTLFFALFFYIFSFLSEPAFVETIYWTKTGSLVVQLIGYLFALNAVYATFQSPKGIFYWTLVLFGILSVLFGVVVYGWGWLLYGQVFTNLITIDITRVSVKAVRQQRKGAWILLAGCVCYLVFWFIFSLQFWGVIVVEQSWRALTTDVSLLSISVTFAIFLAYDFGLTNRVLEQKLTEVETLSAEKQHILATQNERLEQQVEARTTELKASQAQLVQKEKLASLGELTAGIAHEIQNPLNFVNNFSELSAELVDELTEEAQAGHQQDVMNIAQTLKANLQKIHHHGVRAAAIVRGMLEHSRIETGEQRPTNLNALAEEYLKIAYHGMRAKDKSFNAELLTDFDPDLGRVEVVPQDIGRVLLNLFNNAFYAVHQRAKSELEGYQPTVWVNTVRVQNGVQICVRDNGTGIPDTVKSKIFQPFFTTKPTGEGTGLGLSLSYDIVTKGHGGTLTMESTESSGTIFTIQLPTITN